MDININLLKFIYTFLKNNDSLNLINNYKLMLEIIYNNNTNKYVDIIINYDLRFISFNFLNWTDNSIYYQISLNIYDITILDSFINDLNKLDSNIYYHLRIFKLH